MRVKSVFFAVFSGFFALAGCKGADVEYKYPEKVRGKYEMPSERNKADRENKLFGSDGFALFYKEKHEESSALGVNVYLWRAALETLSFMPLASADSAGGVILTDWYEAAKGERFKMTVLITSKSLRADALKVSVFKQILNDRGEWSDAAADPVLTKDTENAVLTRARQLYLATKKD